MWLCLNNVCFDYVYIYCILTLIDTLPETNKASENKPSQKQRRLPKMDPLKMHFLLKMGIFHCYVIFPEGIPVYMIFFLMQLKTKDQVGTLTLKLKKAVPVEVLRFFSCFAGQYGTLNSNRNAWFFESIEYIGWPPPSNSDHKEYVSIFWCGFFECFVWTWMPLYSI